MICGCAALDKLAGAGEVVVDSEGVKTIIKTIPAWGSTIGVGILGLLSTLLGFYKKYRTKAKEKTIIGGVEDLKERFVGWIEGYKKEKKWPTAAEILDFIDAVLRKKAQAENLYVEIRDDVHEVRDEIRVLKAKLNSNG